MKKPILGILSSDKEWNKILSGDSYEKADLYIKAAEKYNVTVCFFRLKDITFKEKTVQVRFKHNKHSTKWQIKHIPIPSVIHNRAIYGLKEQTKVKKLSQLGSIVYNSWNGYSKFKIHQLLKKKKVLKKYLPDTRLFCKKNLQFFLQYHSFFLKPDYGAVGIGIMKVVRVSPSTWKITHQMKTKKKLFVKKESELFPFLSGYLENRKYLLQKTIMLQTYNNNPFDIRVSTQKNKYGKWQVTGMVGKVASKGLYLSNVFQGGSVVRLDTIYSVNNNNTANSTTITPSIKTIKKRLSNAALAIARHLDTKLPALADVGFDFGIDKNGNILLIEMNGRDQRYSFLLATMKDTFRRTYENPVAYGHYLLGKNVQKQNI